jgi:hypothetical protein
MSEKQELENPTAIGDVPTDGASTGSRGSLSGELAALRELNEHRLRLEWRRLYRREPPRLSRDLLMRGVAYRLQEMASGGLTSCQSADLRWTWFARETTIHRQLYGRQQPTRRAQVIWKRSFASRYLLKVHATATLPSHRHGEPGPELWQHPMGRRR